jgi:hypothetical protein
VAQLAVQREAGDAELLRRVGAHQDARAAAV